MEILKEHNKQPDIIQFYESIKTIVSLSNKLFESLHEIDPVHDGDILSRAFDITVDEYTTMINLLHVFALINPEDVKEYT